MIAERGKSELDIQLGTSLDLHVTMFCIG